MLDQHLSQERTPSVPTAPWTPGYWVVLNTLMVLQREISAQLYYMLVMLTKQQSLDRVVSAGPGEGLEAWRLLSQFHKPHSSTRSASLLYELLNFSFDGDVGARILAFDRQVLRYEQASKEKFPENVRIGVLIKNLPETPLKQHLILNSERLKEWDTVKVEVENLRRA